MLALSEWMKGACDFRVFCLVEKDFAFFWGCFASYVGICVLVLFVGICASLLTWVFALRAVFER